MLTIFFDIDDTLYDVTTGFTAFRNGTSVCKLMRSTLGFTSDEQLLKDTLQTTIFVSGASSSSDGRASYILGNEGERVWLPNTLTCWINDLKIVTQTYEQYDPVEKLLVYVTSINSTSWI